MWRGQVWERCPLEDVAEDEHLAVALRLYEWSHTSPLVDWPTGWVAWVTDLVPRVRAAFRKREAADIEARMQEASG